MGETAFRRRRGGSGRAIPAFPHPWNEGRHLALQVLAGKGQSLHMCKGSLTVGGGDAGVCECCGRCVSSMKGQSIM